LLLLPASKVEASRGVGTRQAESLRHEWEAAPFSRGSQVGCGGLIGEVMEDEDGEAEGGGGAGQGGKVADQTAAVNGAGEAVGGGFAGVFAEGELGADGGKGRGHAEDKDADEGGSGDLGLAGERRIGDEGDLGEKKHHRRGDGDDRETHTAGGRLRRCSHSVGLLGDGFSSLSMVLLSNREGIETY